MLHNGLYEQIINKFLAEQLKNADKNIDTKAIDLEESPKILSQYLNEVIEKGLQNIKEKNKKGEYIQIEKQVDLINKIVELVKSETGEEDFDGLCVEDEGKQLLSIQEKTDTIQAVNNKIEIIRPETSLSMSSLFTGAVHEPNLDSELKKEILSSDRIDILVSFIKWSGLRLIIEQLRTFTQNGGLLRIITTSYMGATDIKAIEELRKLPNTEIKVSYDTKRTRLHAKSYVFYRKTGFTTAYVGSSNLSNAAMTSGLEWNIKTTEKDLPSTLKKISATFESYWNSHEFEIYSEKEMPRLEQALKSEKNHIDIGSSNFFFDIYPYSYQEEILSKLDADRKIRNQYKNLLVAATGTGKTVISAFDYKRFRNENLQKKNTLLFIAHREEILKQSVECFRTVLRNQNFGSLFVGNHRPDSIEHLFLSVQTFNSQDFTKKTTADFYDYIIIDEFHHAAAPSYQKILSYYKPKILLGLTATPERMDGQSILKYFDNKISAEIRLPEAIDRKLLSPFQYFGITDSVNLESLKWSRGGYDRNELSNIYTFDQVIAHNRANGIIEAIYKYVTDINEVKGLGFCVSIEHAKFMADYFNSKNISAIALTGQSSDEERNSAKKNLIEGKYRFIFVVDIYNEGVDIPEVNTILFLRPTESLTVFLQQLGRGLRLAENKECLTVLDFIGQAHKKYNFEDKFAALLSNTRHSVQHELKHGFTSVPKGCFIQLEKVAAEHILKNIKSSLSGKLGLISRIASFEEDSGLALNLKNFIEYYHLDIRQIYKSYSFSRLCAEAGVIPNFDEELEKVMTNAFSRFCAFDSRRLISFALEHLPKIEELELNAENIRFLNMLHFSIWQKSYEECGFFDIREGFIKLKNSPVLFAELKEILEFCYDKIDFIDEQVKLSFDCPLDLHCTYTRDQILVAFDFLKPNAMREGAKYFADKKCDIFFVTLNKSEKDYSPSTMYEDYSINDELFHWQSQSTVSADSPTGLRYRNHKENKSNILLFVREFKKDIAGTAPYTFLGLADYVSHEGSKPMSVIWKLHRPIPAKYLKKTNKLMVG